MYDILAIWAELEMGFLCGDAIPNSTGAGSVLEIWLDVKVTLDVNLLLV
jgi:hypothetical protein